MSKLIALIMFNKHVYCAIVFVLVVFSVGELIGKIPTKCKCTSILRIISG